MEWTTACPDWAERLRAGQSIIPRPIFPEQAEQALAVFKELRIVDAAGCPTFGEAGEPWVLDFVAAIFGAYDAESGRRLIREVLMLIPKKNGKSTLAAGIMVTAMILNWRQSAEMIILAPTIKIANNAFAPARDMINADEELRELFQVQPHMRTITHRLTKATLTVLAADSDVVGGNKASWILIDEEWLFGKKEKAESMFREATGGLTSRPEGVVIKLSTQSDEPPAGVFKSDLERMRDIRDGKIVDPASLPVIYEHPPEMVKSRAHLRFENLALVNPNFGVSVDGDHLRREFDKATLLGEASLKGFLAKHGNVQVGLNLRNDRWTGADFWLKATRKALTLKQLLARCEVVAVGIDGGGLDDILALAAVGRERGTGLWLSWVHGWLHPIAIERRKSEETKYRDFEKDGDLSIINELPEDVTAVAQMVKEIYESGLLAKVGLDPEKTHKVMLQALVDAGIPEDLIIGISQGYRLTGAITVAERKLAEGGLVHGGQAFMAWCVGNAKVEQRGNAVLITKQASGTGKIDPVMALLDAVTIMATDPQAPVDLDDLITHAMVV